MAARRSYAYTYCSPESVNLRRDSRGKKGRASFTCSPDPPRVSSSRPYNSTGLTFSYNAGDLKTWLIEDELWARLPREVKAALAAMQHTGAAVSTACSRLHEHDTDRYDGIPAAQVSPQDVISEQKTNLTIRTLSSDSSGLGDSVSNLGDSVYSPIFSSQSSEDTAPSPAFTSSQDCSPTSPNGSFSLPPNEEVFNKSAHRPRDRSVSEPKEPFNTFFKTELSYIRTEAIPRLRHLKIHVDIEMNEAKRRGAVTSDLVSEFETNWAEKRDRANRLDDHIRYLAEADGIPRCGLGWNYLNEKKKKM